VKSLGTADRAASRSGGLPGRPNSVRRGLAHLASLVRWREWYDSKLPLNLAGMSYAVLRGGSPGTAELADMAVLLALLCLYASYGHIANDYSDLAIDRAAGKRRPLAGWGPPAALATIAVTGCGAVLLALARFEAGTAALTALAVLLAGSYSLPPVRLKERGVLGPAAAALAQRTLPLAIVFQALDGWDRTAAALCVLATLIGLRFIILHQLSDRANDLRAGVRTLATVRSERQLELLVTRVLFPLEAGSAGVAVLAMAVFEPAVAAVAAGYVGWLWLKRRRRKQSSPLSYALFRGFYCILWPWTLAALLALRDAQFVVVLALVVALQQRRIMAWLRGSASSRRRKAARRERSRPSRAATSARAAEAVEADGATSNRLDPYPFYAELRDRAPVHRLRWPVLGPMWLVVRHRDALTVFKDPRFVKNLASVAPGAGPARPRRKPLRGFGPDLVELDPPDHTRLRGLVSKAFTPRMVERLDGRIQQLADEALDRVRARGEMELIADYASFIPIVVITELLGVPIADIARFRAFNHALGLSQATGRRDAALEAEKLRFTDELKGLFAARRAEPRDDLISALVQAEQDGDRLSADELLGMTYLLLLGGYVTTANMIGNATFALLRHPDQLDALRRNPDLIESAVEELLRFDSPLELSSVYFAATDLELGGVRIPRGEQVRVVIPSANHDEEQFPDADALDVTRDARGHLAFGQGIHYCLGAPLARLEGRIALRALIERMPGLRLAVPPEQVPWLSHPVLRGLQQLPLRF
jgi:cytochrome P450 PksS